MQIELKEVSRKFLRQTIFTDVSYTFEQGLTYAILGGNGSGKSTLIKILYGALSPSRGEVFYKANNHNIERAKAPFKIALAAPYFELIEELTAKEFLDFHSKFKPFIEGYSTSSILDIAYLKDARNKEIRYFSSGMKQRLRLVLALLSDVSVILLDEPTSNLDPKGVAWYQNLLQEYLHNRTLIIGSNFDENEISLCENRIELKNYKQEKV